MVEYDNAGVRMVLGGFRIFRIAASSLVALRFLIGAPLAYAWVGNQRHIVSTQHST